VSKCILCGKKKGKVDFKIKEWIIDGKNPAKEGVTHSVHSECLSERLYIEKPEGFIYGRVTLPGKKKGAKITK